MRATRFFQLGRKSMAKPIAIIAKLEDCPVWLDRTPGKACREADLRY